MRYVIVGGGIAGTTAAEELRKLEPQAQITIVSEEQHPIYSRVLLPHYIKEKVPRERCFLKKESWYAEQNIEWLPGVRVLKLDTRNKFVGLSNGREYEYDKLLLTTGGDVRHVEFDARGVSYFRTIDDADHMLTLLNERAEMDRAAIYGGGFIACEYLNIFEHFSVPQTIVMRGPHFWTRFFDVESGNLLNTHLEQSHVKVMTNVDLIDVKGEKQLEGIVTSKGDVDCTMLGVGIGIAPDFSWVNDGGVDTEYGIRTNEYLETNVPDVYAAGDICQFDDIIVDRSMFVGNWMNAMMQGRAVAQTMAGDRKPFKLVSSYATNALGLEMIFVGDTERAAADQIVVRGSSEAGGVTQLFVRNARLVGATMVGSNMDRSGATKLIQTKTPILDKIEDLSDPDNTLE